MASYPAKYIWMNGEYVEWPDARLHVNTVAVLTGANVFEGLRAYSNPDERQVYVFRLQEHLARLWQSMKVMRMTPPFTRDELTAACTGLVARNGFHEDVQVRPTVYFGEGGLYAFTPDKIRPGRSSLRLPVAARSTTRRASPAASAPGGALPIT